MASVRVFVWVGLLIGFVAGSGCRSVYYATWEKLGREKRDLLRASLEETQEVQKETSDQFRDTLFQLKELYGFTGGELEERYESFKSEYEDSRSRADKFRSRADDVEQIGNDLFEEWENEIGQISDASANLRAASRRQLGESRARHRKIVRGLHEAEAAMESVLTRMNDYVLYLKHNLNAQAIGALRDEAISIENDIVDLIGDINESVIEVQDFLRESESAGAP